MNAGPATWVPAEVAVSYEVRDERDRILSLLAYSIAFSDWQRDWVRPERGHNIAAVLVERATGRSVFWARNCNAIKNNGTQHAETQLMWHFLEKSGTKYLDKYEIYTTLEPCAGMMCLSQVKRAVYGQTDLGYGKAIERLQNSPDYGPYPRTPEASLPSATVHRTQLDEAFAEFGSDNITAFLRTEVARRIYEMASKDFQAFKVTHPENRSVYDSAFQLYRESCPKPTLAR
ncbi:MAG TPA: nucleic acid/nucleotide deaminase domain-containing protein [Pirellulaceae bacterium]|nr:nucleic acid/nucleotide deaminase domain-containing protein [Pirellulaceae bacterium]